MCVCVCVNVCVWVPTHAHTCACANTQKFIYIYRGASRLRTSSRGELPSTANWGSETRRSLLRVGFFFLQFPFMISFGAVVHGYIYVCICMFMYVCMYLCMYVMYIYIYIYLNSPLTNSRTPTLLTLLTLLNRALTTNALNLLYHTQPTQPSKYIYIDIDPAYVNVSIYIYRSSCG